MGAGPQGLGSAVSLGIIAQSLFSDSWSSSLFSFLFHVGSCLSCHPMHCVSLSDIFPLLTDVGLSFHLVYFLFPCAFLAFHFLHGGCFVFLCCRKDLLCIFGLWFLPWGEKKIGGCGGRELIASISVLNFSAKLGLGAVEGFSFSIQPTCQINPESWRHAGISPAELVFVSQASLPSSSSN